MDKLLGDLVDAAHIGTGHFQVQPEQTDLVAIARQAIETAAITATTRRIVLDAPERLEGEWDRERLAQVLDNLIRNAVKYSPGGGEIRVRVWREGDAARVSVFDEGLGIRPDDLPRLFQPFARSETGEQITGSGLGLYIARGIVEAHGGHLWAESAGLGKGAAFSFGLPLKRP
jgi:signal transduction histidine kinase